MTLEGFLFFTDPSTIQVNYEKGVAMRTKLVVVAAGVLVICGCVASGVIINEQQVQSFKRGETTEGQIIAALGAPTSRSNINGVRSISYTGVYAQARPASFIPYIGGLVGGSDVRHSSYTFTFDSSGKLTNLISTEGATGTGQGFAAGGSMPQTEAQPRQPDTK